MAATTASSTRSRTDLRRRAAQPRGFSAAGAAAGDAGPLPGSGAASSTMPETRRTPHVLYSLTSQPPTRSSITQASADENSSDAVPNSPKIAFSLGVAPVAPAPPKSQPPSVRRRYPKDFDRRLGTSRRSLTR